MAPETNETFREHSGSDTQGRGDGNSPGLSMRLATIGDLELLLRWDEAPQVVEADPNDDWNWEVELARDLVWRELWIAEVDGIPIGMVQIIDPFLEETRYWGAVPDNLRAIDIWIGEATYLGQGFGTTMMRSALERCFASPDVVAVLIDPLESNTRARRFYERLGFVEVGPRRFDLDDCMVYSLDRETWTSRYGLSPGA